MRRTKNGVLFCSAPVLAVVCAFAAAQAARDPYTLNVSLPKPTIHVNSTFPLTVTKTNSTDHRVWACAFVEFELTDHKGQDIGRHLKGLVIKGAFAMPSGAGVVSMPMGPNGLADTVIKVLPKSSDYSELQVTPDPGILVPGTYKLRVHCMHSTIREEVFSNAVTLTVIP
jgi:hypothetical protein